MFHLLNRLVGTSTVLTLNDTCCSISASSQPIPLFVQLLIPLRVFTHARLLRRHRRLHRHQNRNGVHLEDHLLYYLTIC